jgi:hypothetical protein
MSSSRAAISYPAADGAREGREVAIDDDEFSDCILPDDDPELSLLRAEYRQRVDAALRAGRDALGQPLLASLRHG